MKLWNSSLVVVVSVVVPPSWRCSCMSVLSSCILCCNSMSRNNFSRNCRPTNTVDTVHFSVTTITHEPLHSVGCNFAWTCTLTTARNPENFKVKGQGHRTSFLDSLPLWDRARKFVCTITDEPLHSAWWYFAWTCTLRTAQSLSNFKVMSKVKVIFSLVDQSSPNCLHWTWNRRS